MFLEKMFFYGKNAAEKINNPAASSGVCCSHKVLDSGFNTFLTAASRGVLNPSPRIKQGKLRQKSFRERAFLYTSGGNSRVSLLVMLFPWEYRQER